MRCRSLYREPALNSCKETELEKVSRFENRENEHEGLSSRRATPREPAVINRARNEVRKWWSRTAFLDVATRLSQSEAGRNVGNASCKKPHEKYFAPVQVGKSTGSIASLP